MKKKIFSTFLIVGAGLMLTGILSAFSSYQQKKPWVVPDVSKNKKNTVASDAASIAEGKALWATHCKSCHGNKGKGDGTKAKELKTEPGDFTKPDVQAQTDGALFYKTSIGRDDMPGFKKKLPEADEIWSIVNFMRTMKQ